MQLKELHKEINYKTSKSSGAGGQNVNKVSTKVMLLFDVGASEALSQKEKEIVNEKLANRINSDGLLQLQCDETRSQLKNKEIVFSRLITMLQEALKPVKKRKPSKPSKAAVQKRIDAKKKQSQKKDLRGFNPKKD